jgi:hypothetical protein
VAAKQETRKQVDYTKISKHEKQHKYLAHEHNYKAFPINTQNVTKKH